jgi:hypothetical protein
MVQSVGAVVRECAGEGLFSPVLWVSRSRRRAQERKGDEEEMGQVREAEDWVFRSGESIVRI